MTDILDVYDMTPMQAGMLFQSLYAPEQGSYVQQYWGRLDGALDAEAFRAAWDGVIARHDILRAQCHWDDLDHPALAIHGTASPQWTSADWRALDSEAAEARLQDWLEEDRARGFDMAAVPLMRFALLRLGAESHVFVWTFHHLLLDGWSGARVVREMLDLYGGIRPAQPPVAFRDFVDWRAGCDQQAAEDYWRTVLAGFEGPTPLGIARADTGETGLRDHRVPLPASLGAALSATAARERLTLATLMQGLGRCCCRAMAGRGM